jgi:hypothetical protein
LGHEQPEPLVALAHLAHQTMQSSLMAKGAAGRSRHLLKHHEAHVVACAGIAGTGVA